MCIRNLKAYPSQESLPPNYFKKQQQQLKIGEWIDVAMKSQNRGRNEEEMERPLDVISPSIFMVKLTRLL